MSRIKTLIGIQCRISSSRLPCKALLNLLDTTVLGMCIERAKLADHPVFLLTSDEEGDDLIVRAAVKHGVDGVIRGSIDNVLSRYVRLAKQVSCDYIVRVTADNPLTEYGFVDPLINHVSQRNLPYSWVDPSTCPEGSNIEIFSKQGLFESAIVDSSNLNLEHVTSYMRRSLSPNQCPKDIGSIYFPFDCSRLSFTVDTLSDYVRLVKVVDSVANELRVSWKSPDFVRACAEFAFKNTRYHVKVRNHPF